MDSCTTKAWIKYGACFLAGAGSIMVGSRMVSSLPTTKASPTCCGTQSSTGDHEEDIKKAIRDTYGSVAKTGSNLFAQGTHGKKPSSSCCGESDADPLLISMKLGYTKEELEAIPKSANMGLGCGNTRTIAEYKAGEVAVDLGCGGGLDAFIAAPHVLPGGRVIGVDFSHDMLAKARANRKSNVKKYGHCEFRLGEIEHLPIADNTADVIVSNCVVNLSTQKQAVFNEAYRVLKPGGRVAISDMVLFKELPPELKTYFLIHPPPLLIHLIRTSDDLSLICGCMGSAAPIVELRKVMMQAGFESISITEKKGFGEIVKGWAPGKGIEKYCTSAWITATKPLNSAAKGASVASLDTATPGFDRASEGGEGCGPGG
eukprot:jgi/Bigna1/87849/estExt_fgenesh1_pg.C_250020